MKKTFENLDELSGCIPNPAGVPCQNAHSEKIRKEHNRWKNAVQKRKDEKEPTITYWANMSSCVAL
jgi:hypothetical protein